MTDPKKPTEADYAAGLTPFAKEIADFVKSRVPGDTEFAVLLVPSGQDTDGLRRIVAVSSNRDRMAFYAAQWSLDIHNRKEQR